MAKQPNITEEKQVNNHKYYRYGLKRYINILSPDDFLDLLDLYSNNKKIEICCLLEDNFLCFLKSYKGLSYCIYNYLLYSPYATEEDIKKIYINELKKYKTVTKSDKFHINNEISKKWYIDLIQDLQQYLQSNFIKTNLIGYRYTCKEEFNNIVNLKSNIIPQFLSLTANPMLIDKDLHYNSEQNIIIKYLIPKYSKGIVIPDHKQQKNEYEILLPHHTKIKLLKKDFDTNLQKEIYLAKIEK